MKKQNILITLLITICCTQNFSQNFSIYVSDAGNFNNPPWQILKYDENGENPTVFINTNLNWPQDILFLESENVVLISNLGSGCINKHDAITGEFIEAFACGIGGPTRTQIGPDSLLYVLQWTGNGKVRRYELDGTFVDEFTDLGVSQSIGFDWDAEGNLYISSYNGDSVRKFNADGEDQGIFIDTNLLGPTNIWFDDNGDLLVADYNGTAVKRYDSTGTYQGDYLSGLSNCEGVAILPNGNILIGNGGTGAVKEFDEQGTFIRDIVPANSGNLLRPNAVIIRTNPTTSTTEIDSTKPSFIYPNIGTQFQLKTNELTTLDSIFIYDQTGKLAEKINWAGDSALNLGHLANGLYFIVLQLPQGATTERIIIQH